ncbi:hypothetical protein GCM10007874_22670 [Labrys miyagiensis]|uniref:Uncharacterized protein n=1 Tax=Labrys miyagiensis TaxID=346912 RepID=A0ABQ6CGH2_9HYPH|nr:phasin family protein [Labrys miyagiensis]GLS19250.1 hypothetical protein GCM10007874_22670 [Labrys miyagiensis]
MLSFSTMFLRAVSSALEANHASAVTISHRMPILASLTFWPHPDSLKEANRMVMEKFEAMAEGTLAASRQMVDLSLRAAMGKADADDIATGMMAVAVAAAKPAQRRVRANARRLSKG